jgi:hypothetical protein
MCDIGIKGGLPADNQIQLQMLDEQTYHEVIDEKIDTENLKDEWKIRQMKCTLEALHTNMLISEVIFSFNGYVVLRQGERFYYDTLA